jgi:acyl-CoA synthetase (NDP forming)
LNALVADAAGAAGLQVVELSTPLQEEFAGLAPHLAGVANPVDLGADAPPATIWPQLPIIAVVVGGEAPLKLGRGNVPVYTLPEDAVRSLGHAAAMRGGDPPNP